MTFLIVKPSPLSILIPLGPRYSPQDPVSNNVREHVSQPYSTTNNIIVLYIKKQCVQKHRTGPRISIDNLERPWEKHFCSIEHITFKMINGLIKMRHRITDGEVLRDEKKKKNTLDSL